MKLKDLISVMPYYGGIEAYNMRDSGAPIYSCMWNEKFEPPYALLDMDVCKIYGDLDYSDFINNEPCAVTVIELKGDTNG